MPCSSPSGADWKSVRHERRQLPSAGQALFAAEPPKLSLPEAEALALRHYGLAAQATLLSSERDQNFLLRDAAGGAYVLKATHPAEDPAVTDFHTGAAAPDAGRRRAAGAAPDRRPAGRVRALARRR
ncbi:hypothetical protein WJ967_13910 [Achromobacter xylosoxidans]